LKKFANSKDEESKGKAKKPQKEPKKEPELSEPTMSELERASNSDN